MTLQDFYVLVDGNLEEVSDRLLSTERIMKYLNKFANMEDFDKMVLAIDEEDWEVAFRMSHNLKGMCQNLGINALGKVSSELCETMRNGKPEVFNEALLEDTRKEYNKTIEAIKSIEV